MDKNSTRRYSVINALKIIFNYLIFSAVWIVISGIVLNNIHISPSVRNAVEIYKGLLYVIVTSLFLYPLIKKELYASREAIEKLKVSEQNFSRLFESASLGVFQSTPEGKIIMVNQAFSKMFGYKSPEEVNKFVGKKSIEIYADENRRKQIIELKSRNPELNNFEVEYRRKDGSTFIGNLNLNLINDEAGKILFIEGFIEDITQRKDAEDKLKIFAQAIKSISECISITDKNNTILFVNDAFLKTYGYSRHELIGKSVNVLHQNVVTNSEEENILFKTSSGGWRGELINVKKDGTRFPVYLSTSAIKDEQGNTLALIGVANDITEMKRNREELISAKNEAEKANRMKTEFLEQMSHEIRSPLNISLSYTNIIKEELGNEISPEINEYFKIIEISSRRLTRTIDLILNMSEMQLGIYNAEYERIDLVNDIMLNLNREFSGLCAANGLEYNFKNDTSDSVLMCDRYSVSQIFVNILDNSVKYTSKGKIEVLVSRNEEALLQVTVSDTGIGMSREFIEKLFEPFTQEEHGYSRKYEGNGLGLALVKKYCELNHADIKVESEKEIGSKFLITFKNS